MPTGAAVRLMPHQEVLGIAEGIETALSASILFNVPIWAALTAGLLQEWTPPASVTTVFVFGDNDASSTGQAAAYSLGAAAQGKGAQRFRRDTAIDRSGLERRAPYERHTTLNTQMPCSRNGASPTMSNYGHYRTLTDMCGHIITHCYNYAFCLYNESGSS